MTELKTIEIGFEIGNGESVVIEPNHTFIAGTTGTGKSKAMQRLITGAESRLLIVDAKRKRDYAGLNADIPLYIKQQMEPIVIKDSIETTERFTIKQQFGTLLDTVAESESWGEMLEVIEREMTTQKSGYIRNNLKILKYFIKRLVKEYAKFLWSDKLELNKGISVLNISKMSIQMQQLVVGSVINYIQENLTDVTVIIDEAHRFIPQGQTSGCSRDIVTFIREGRASENWVWLADQTVTGISKDLLKQMQYWILGRQSELNEAQRTVKQIPRAKSLGVNIEEIQTLGLGEFLVVCPEWAKKTYIWPLWIDRETAQKVALGQLTAKQVARQEKKHKTEDDDEMWRQQFELEQKARIEAQKETEDLKHKISEMSKVEPVDNTEIDNIKDAYMKEQLKWTTASNKMAEEIKLLKTKLESKEPDNTELDELKTEVYLKGQLIEQSKKAGQKDQLRIKLLETELETQKLGSQAFEKLRKLLGSSSVQHTATVGPDELGKLKTEIKREIIAEVGTGIITVTEDIDLGKIYQENAYKAIISMIDEFDDDTIKILGYLLHIGKGVPIKEITWAVYHKKSKRELGRSSPEFDKRMAIMKKELLTEERGGRIHCRLDELVKERMATVGVNNGDYEPVLAKVKGFVAKKLRGESSGV